MKINLCPEKSRPQFQDTDKEMSSSSFVQKRSVPIGHYLLNYTLSHNAQFGLKVLMPLHFDAPNYFGLSLCI